MINTGAGVGTIELGQAKKDKFNSEFDQFTKYGYYVGQIETTKKGDIVILDLDDNSITFAFTEDLQQVSKEEASMKYDWGEFQEFLNDNK